MSCSSCTAMQSGAAQGAVAHGLHRPLGAGPAPWDADEGRGDEEEQGKKKGGWRNALAKNKPLPVAAPPPLKPTPVAEQANEVASPAGDAKKGDSPE